MEKTVNTAQVNESTVVGDVLHNTGHRRTLGEVLKQLAALFAHAGFNHSTAREHYIVALAIKLNNLELKRFAFNVTGVFYRTRINQRTGQKGTDAIGHHSEAALHLAGNSSGNKLGRVKGLL